MCDVCEKEIERNIEIGSELVCFLSCMFCIDLLYYLIYYIICPRGFSNQSLWGYCCSRNSSLTNLFTNKFGFWCNTTNKEKANSIF